MVVYHPPMPLHDLDSIHSLVRAEAWDLATRRCRLKVQELGLTRIDVREMLLTLRPGNHRKEWGEAQTDFGVVMVDDYTLDHDGCCFYIKLGIHTIDEGDACLIASFHLESAP
jgi:hypothetical protein